MLKDFDLTHLMECVKKFVILKCTTVFLILLKNFRTGICNTPIYKYFKHYFMYIENNNSKINENHRF